MLSTGRCGTQWLAEALRATAGKGARVEHEPLHNDYAPRRMLGASDPAALDPRQRGKVLAHVDAIERELAARGYIETGHPCWSSLPWLCARLAGRIRIVHLVRHPVPTACSWVSHGAFVPPLLPHVPAKEFIAPTDAGVSFPEYRESWDALSPFEKSLVYWAEVNAFALRLERAGGRPWLRVAYEQLFDPGQETLAKLLEFLEWPPDAERRIDRGDTVDEHRFPLMQWPEIDRIGRHPRVIAVAGELGYRMDGFSRAGLAERFGLRG